MSVFRALAPAKVNLGLFVGPLRASDSRHELVSVMQSISLADELTLETAPAGSEHDEVICPGVPGSPRENLASLALQAFRVASGWDAPPQLLRIHKRIPVAAGLAGGSADAAATLRLASLASGIADERLLCELGAGLGADVPAQVTPGRWLVGGAGERLQPLPAPAEFGLLLLPAAVGLSTAAVFAQADRLRAPRELSELQQLRASVQAELCGAQPLPARAELLHNDLQAAAIALCPPIEQALEEARGAGATVAMVSGSGPTVVGLFAADGEGRMGGLAAARRAAGALRDRVPAAIWATPVQARFAQAVRVDAPAADAAHPRASQSAQRTL